MKILSTLLAASALVFGAQAASAALSPAGTYTFKSDVNKILVQKDMDAYACDMEVTVVVASDGSATATAGLSGDFPCPLIGISGTGTVTTTVSGTTERVTISGLTITAPLSAGTCTGSITADVLDTTAGKSVTEILLSTPLSDSSATGGAPCKMIGRLLQATPSSPQLQVI